MPFLFNREKKEAVDHVLACKKIILIRLFPPFFLFINWKGGQISSMDVTMTKMHLMEFASWLMSFQANSACQTVQVMMFGVSSKATRK